MQGGGGAGRRKSGGNGGEQEGLAEDRGKVPGQGAETGSPGRRVENWKSGKGLRQGAETEIRGEGRRQGAETRSKGKWAENWGAEDRRQRKRAGNERRFSSCSANSGLFGGRMELQRQGCTHS